MTTDDKEKGKKPPRRFVVWAVVNHEEVIIEMPAGADDAACDDACQDAVDNLICNGDTGWVELKEKGARGEREPM